MYGSFTESMTYTSSDREHAAGIGVDTAHHVQRLAVSSFQAWYRTVCTLRCMKAQDGCTGPD